jgi:hypothetical protein
VILSLIHPFISRLENLNQLRHNSIAHLGGARVAAQVAGEGAVVDGAADRLLDGVGLLGQAERVAQHHGHREDGADGVDDALARDVRGGAWEEGKSMLGYRKKEQEESEIGLDWIDVLTVNRLINAVAPALAIRDAPQTGTGQQADAARNHRRLVADDVAEQVAREDNTIKRARVLDHDHGGAVDQLMAQLELRELLGKHLGHDLAPEAARGQHVGLVQAPDLGGRVARERQEPGEAGDALNLGARVGLRVEGVPGAVVLGALAKVDAARQLADHDEVGAAADVGFQRGPVDHRFGREAARAQVAVGAELLAELQQALLGADGGGRAPFRAADGAEENGVGGFGGGESLVGQGVVVDVDGGLGEVLAGIPPESKKEHDLRHPGDAPGG